MADELVNTKKRVALLVPPSEDEKSQINKNFKTLAKMFHPDLIGAEQGEEIMKILGEARDKLFNMSVGTYPPHIGVILDSSGSMNWQRFTVINAYNNFINYQKGHPDVNATFSFTTFRKQGKIVKLHKAELVSERTYQCSGGTPLHDTIARTIFKIEEAGKVNVVVVIFTDGREQSSQEYRNPEKIKALIERKIAEGWQFIFCTSEKMESGLRIGIKQECITNFVSFEEVMKEFGSKLLQYRKGEVKQITFEGSDGSC